MCGRYAASANPDELVEAYDVEVDATDERSRSVVTLVTRNIVMNGNSASSGPPTRSKTWGESSKT